MTSPNSFKCDYVQLKFYQHTEKTVNTKTKATCELLTNFTV